MEREILAEENEVNEEEEEEDEEYEDEHDYRLDQKDEEGRYDARDQRLPEFAILTPEDAIRATEYEREQGIHVDESVLRQRMFSVRDDKSTPIINENILFEKVNYIDLEGKFQADVSTESILEGINLHKHVLVLVASEQRTARLFLKKDFEQHRVKSKQSQRKSGAGKTAKARQMQITWNIGDNDLHHRLRKASEYLKKGDRLDLILGARKSKLTRDKDQRDAMLATIRKTLEPYGYEWMKMSQKFPNVELWFQGYDPKKKEELATAILDPTPTPDQEQQPQSNPEGTNSTTDAEVDISGQDDRYLSEEEAEASTFRVRDRKQQLLEAEEKWKALFGPKYQDDPYWKLLSDPNYKPPDPAPFPPKPPPPEEKEKAKEKKPRKDKNHDVEAVKAEFDRKMSAEKLATQQRELERLKTVATQFARLGSGKKSMFGGKLAGK